MSATPLARSRSTRTTPPPAARDRSGGGAGSAAEDAGPGLLRLRASRVEGRRAAGPELP